MFSKKKITFELDERYFNKKDLMDATIKHLREQGYDFHYRIVCNINS
ncbi:hypothetical protein RBU49_01830 [Clostridium sp. MB40-C1]|nr:hypothetical protein [Clostridium sp. MB40-C1]WMJ81018.1 hypothetical protein RBU49_01830 [Clostridium sp. MB40-C1]